ncbi:MAG: oligosaccharide flippase family protein [Candidatus Roizmanbacteria bacterium]
MLKKIFSSGTAKNVIINTLGSYIGIAITVLSVVILARTLGREVYGELAVLFSFAYLMTNILDFGSPAIIYSQVPQYYLLPSRSNLYSFIKSTFYFQTMACAVVIVALLVLFPTLDRSFFKTHAPYSALALTAISIALYVWQNTISNMLFAMKRFSQVNIWLNVSYVVRTVSLLALIPLGLVTIPNIIFLFGVISPLVFIVCIYFLYRPSFEKVRRAKVELAMIRPRYTLTNFIAQQFFNVGMRMDLFILSYFGLKTVVADYSLSQKIILTIISTVVSITQVLSPSYTHIKTRVGVMKEFRHSMLFLLIPTALFLSLSLVPAPLYKLILTAKFIETPLFSAHLGIVYSLYCIGQVFMLFLLYTFRKPSYLLISNIAFFVVVTIACYFLIPMYRGSGAIYAIGLGFIVVILLQAAGFVREYAKLK